MGISRRNFLRAVAASGAGVTALPFISGRGSEALAGYRASRLAGALHPLELAARARLNHQDAIQLDSNENPYGASKGAQDAVRNELPNAPYYPYEFVESLRTTVADLHKVDIDSVLIGSGSSEILRMALYAFVSPQRHLVTAAPTYEDPAYYAQLNGADVRAVHVDASLRLDLPRMAAAARGSGLVFFCNPNNPTGTLYRPDAVNDFVRSVRQNSSDTVILIDEAYQEYVEDPAHRSAIPLATENRNVIVSRTFSKIFGMAGLRVGYAIAHPDTTYAMSPHRLIHGVNLFGASAARACVTDSSHIGTQRRLNREAREFIHLWFENAGYKVTPSHASYIMVDIRRDTANFQYDCASYGVLVGRPFPPLNTHARISIGSMDDMRKASDVFRRILSRR
jgi:histidinol-phosphate aminotransferase